MKDVAGKTACITGGASGIGLGLAKVFAEAGMKVVVADIRRDHLDEAMARLKDVHEYGMDPVEVGEKTLAALKRGDFYIFTHPEFKEELRGIFDEILATFPDEEPDPDRLAFEEDRRRRLAETKAKLPRD